MLVKTNRYMKMHGETIKIVSEIISGFCHSAFPLSVKKREAEKCEFLTKWISQIFVFDTLFFLPYFPHASNKNIKTTAT